MEKFINELKNDIFINPDVNLIDQKFIRNFGFTGDVILKIIPYENLGKKLRKFLVL